MGWGLLDWLPLIIGAALVAYWVAILIVLIIDGRPPARTLVWVMVLVALPGLGLVLYFFFGRNLKKKTMKGGWIKEVRRLSGPTLDRIGRQYAEESAEARRWCRENGYSDLVRLIETSERSHPLPAYDVDVITSGREKFDKLFADLAAATDTINMQYFIWERDELSAQLTEVLLGCLRAGVEVRILNDFIGNIQYRKDELARLRAAGARVKYDLNELGRVNYRDHRKIVVIDGVRGYTGGINVGQRYVDGGPRYPAWRDTHVRYTGAAVSDLQKLFATRWHSQTGEDLFSERFFPAEYPAGATRSFAHTVSTGVESPWEPARRAHVVAIGLARDRLWIQSPYFVPNDAVFEAILNSALSGVDVRIMMTGLPDKKVAWYAAQSYFGPVLEAGGRIFHYTDGFFHPKTMTVDAALCSIGTMNLDVRSLELHEELMVWFYDPALARRHDRIFQDDLKRCDEITLDWLDSLTPMQVFRNSAARLASDLL